MQNENEAVSKLSSSAKCLKQFREVLHDINYSRYFNGVKTNSMTEEESYRCFSEQRDLTNKAAQKAWKFMHECSVKEINVKKEVKSYGMDVRDLKGYFHKKDIESKSEYYTRSFKKV